MKAQEEAGEGTAEAWDLLPGTLRLVTTSGRELRALVNVLLDRIDGFPLLGCW